MLPKYHIVFGAIVTVAIYFIFPITILQSAIIFLTSFLIDVDHYLYYIFVKKDFSSKNAVKWFTEKRNIWMTLNYEQRKYYKYTPLIFHGIEFWFIIIILAQIYNIFYFILAGIAIHMLLDYIEFIFITKTPLYPKTSQIMVLLKNKRKKVFNPL